MKSTTVRAFTRDDPKRSWWPAVLGIFLPIAVIAGLVGISVAIKGRDGGKPAEVAEVPISDAYVTVKAVTADGVPIPGREVTFVHNRLPARVNAPGSAFTVYTSKTDSAGMATMTVPRQGNVSIKVEGAGGEKRIKDLERSASKFYELTIVMDAGGNEKP